MEKSISRGLKTRTHKVEVLARIYYSIQDKVGRERKRERNISCSHEGVGSRNSKWWFLSASHTFWAGGKRHGYIV
jgi:hypothetical protein